MSDRSAATARPSPRRAALTVDCVILAAPGRRLMMLLGRAVAADRSDIAA